MMTLLIAIALAYLIGSIPFAVLVSKMMGLPDPRTYGSNNPGATNVLRSGNKLAAILTLVGDMAKGWIAVAPLLLFSRQLELGEVGIALVALSALLGHLFPVWLNFKGGKGVATAAGVLLGLKPVLGLAVVAVWLCTAFVFRYSSLAALVAALFAPLASSYLVGWESPLTWCAIAMAALLIWRHAANIRKLMAGEESKIGAKEDSDSE